MKARLCATGAVMISMPKLSALATSLSLVLYAPWAHSTEVTPNYTIEFAQPASASANSQASGASNENLAPVAPSNTAQSAQGAKPAPMGALNNPRAYQPTSTMNFGTSNQSMPVTASNTTMYEMPQSAVSQTTNQVNSQPSAQPASQDALDSYNLERQARVSAASGQNQYPAAPSKSMTIQYGLQDHSVPMTSTATNPPPAQSASSATPMSSVNVNSEARTGVATVNTNASYASLGTQGQSEYEVEVIDSQAQIQKEAAQRQTITDQTYPAAMNENGTDDFYQSENARMQQSMQAQKSVMIGQASVESSANTVNVSNTATTTNNTNITSNSPSFTFESVASAEPTKPSNVFPLGSHAVTTPDGRQIMVGPDGMPLLDSNGQQIPAPLEQIQEVSVIMLTSLDSALINAFKSLESGLTLGLGQNNHEYTLDDIAPALRGYDFDENGNLLVRFSVNSAESIIKRHGSLSWSGLSNPILVWMVGLDEVNHSNNLSLVSGQNLSTFAQAIINAAPDYKYRLMFPILDLEDVQKVKVSTVLNHQDDVLAQASQRYGSDYFISAAIDNVNDDGTGVALKWNLYNKKGELIAQSSLSGLVEEVASLGANDIARAVMTYQEELRKNPEAVAEDSKPTELNANNVDINRLGAGDGFIRIRVENVRALSDFQEMRKAFVTYGYDGDIRIVGYDNGAMILEVVTNSDVVHLEGTLRRAGDFKYLAPWTYQFNSTAVPRRSMQDQNLSSQGVNTSPFNAPQTANNEHVLLIRNN